MFAPFQHPGVLRCLLTAALLSLSAALAAQDYSALARIDPDASRIRDYRADGVEIDLSLSQGVPYRMFTLDNPPRLVVDFREVLWSGLTPAQLLATDRTGQVRFGAYVPGWSRLVLDLQQPMGIDAAQMQPGPEMARLRVTLAPVSAARFAETSGAPYDPRWDLPEPALPPRSGTRSGTRPAEPGPDAPMRVVIDPGHGGIDPGAEAGGVNEKTLMLGFARELREVLLRSDGFDVVLTRDDDYFVSLEGRIALAHRARADVFLSLHADNLIQGQAHGAAIYTLSEEASDVASEKLAERHDRAELLSGLDLSDVDDQITAVLLDLSRQETEPRTRNLALALADAMAQAGGPMNRRPLRQAGFSVLKAADIPSVLIELGFLSSPRDFRNLNDPQWRAGMAVAIRNGLQSWHAQEETLQPLIRK